MWNKKLFLFILLLLIQACGKPKGTIFEDNSLAQEELVKICMTGDMGKDTELQEAMAEALGRGDCDRIFFLGDLIYPKGIDSVDDPELDDKFLSYYAPLLEKDPELVIGLILGNHDHAGDPSAWLDVGKKFERIYFPNYYYMIDYGGLCVVALDTSFYYYEKKVLEATEQTVWLTRLQSRLKKCDVKVAITHHPFKGGGYAGDEDDWERAKGQLKVFLDSYVIGNFDLHVAGHVHIVADDGKDEGTRMLISGAGGELHGGGRPGYIVLTWEPSNPKKLGYYIQYFDSEVTVEGYPPQEQEAEKIEDPFHEGIPKTRVEEPWFAPIIDFFKF